MRRRSLGGGDPRGLTFEVKKASFQLTEYCRELLCLAGRSSFGERDQPRQAHAAAPRARSYELA